MGFTVVLGLRIAQFICALITMGLSAYVFHWYDTATLTDPPTQINFLIAAPIFTFLSIAYLEITPRFAQKFSFAYVHAALEVINTLFYFGGFIALATFLSKLLFCRGKVCSAARAADIFAVFSFLLWAGTTAILGLEIFRGGLAGMAIDRKAKKAMDEQKKNNNAAGTEMRGAAAV